MSQHNVAGKLVVADGDIDSHSHLKVAGGQILNKLNDMHATIG